MNGLTGFPLSLSGKNDNGSGVHPQGEEHLEKEGQTVYRLAVVPIKRLQSSGQVL